ncbi:MAG: hypothetical protein F2667_11060, partial [Actinobacteria bacterium]|nr:hypothetical protein [Actinomycetota bacterium]
MIWVGLLLIGAGTSDLVFSWLRRPIVPEIVGALLVLTLALGCGLTSWASWACVLLVAGLVVVWGQLVGWGFGRHRPAVPLTAGALALATCIALAPVDGAVGGPVGDWLDASGLAWAAADVHLVVVLGVLL